MTLTLTSPVFIGLTLTQAASLDKSAEEAVLHEEAANCPCFY